MKSATRRALFISLSLHLFLLVTAFYVLMQNQPLSPVKGSIEAALIPVAKPLQPKVPLKKHAPAFREPMRDTAAVSIARVESIAPEVGFQPSLVSTRPVDTTQPRLSQVLVSPEITPDVSTASRALRNVARELPTTEATGVTGGSSYGTKRSGVLRVPKSSSTMLNVTAQTAHEEVFASKDNLKNQPVVNQTQFRQLMKGLAQEIVATSNGSPVDVVFLIDASGSMGDNIKAVAEHLMAMIDVYTAAKIDYALGLTQFWMHQDLERNIIKVFQLTKSLAEYKRTIRGITPQQDENALDAIVQTVKELRFRATSKRHFILVTDETFTSLKKQTVDDAIAYCREFGIAVNVLGLRDDEHQKLAAETSGKWHRIPQDAPKPRGIPKPHSPGAVRSKMQTLRNAQWANIGKIGGALTKHAAEQGGQTPLDVILFIDASKSMEDKLPHFLQQLELLVRDWDNALIDYQIGVVRFRTRASVNMVNVFNPPQTLGQVRKIAELPCQENEMLLDAVEEGLRRMQLRRNAQLHLILITDEPAEGKYSAAATIQLLQQMHARVSVVGTFDDFQQQVAAKTGGVWVPIPEGHTTNNLYW